MADKITKPGRTPCINPQCNRTGSASEFPGEMICGKCYKTLPPKLKATFRHRWKQYNLYRRRIMRTHDEIKIVKYRNMCHFWGEKIDEIWKEIKSHIITPEKPEGLEAFLKEAGLE